MPEYFYQKGDKSATLNPIEYIKKTRGALVSHMSIEELQVEASTMLLLRKSCTNMAVEDLSIYTSTMASILDVKCDLLGCEAPVLDRKEWIQSIIEQPSNLQIQKWIFAWMFARANYKKFVVNLKHPDEIFEERFMNNYGLQYDIEMLQNMKKNTKTCICLLYNVRARSWKDKMMAQLREKLSLNLSITAPKDVRKNVKGFRREPNTFFIGKLVDGKQVWSEVRRCICVIVVTFLLIYIGHFCRYATRIV